MKVSGAQPGRFRLGARVEPNKSINVASDWNPIIKDKFLTFCMCYCHNLAPIIASVTQ